MALRELVIKALEFDKPERIPRQLWTLPWVEERYPKEIEKIHSDYPDDIVVAPSFYKTKLPQVGYKFKKGVFVDE